MTGPDQPAGDDGREPDARFTFANERTFLAWHRTALALVVAALAIIQLLPPFPGMPSGRHLLAVPLMCSVRSSRSPATGNGSVTRALFAVVSHCHRHGCRGSWLSPSPRSRSSRLFLPCLHRPRDADMGRGDENQDDGDKGAGHDPGLGRERTHLA
jgi:hypothetical protein